MHVIDSQPADWFLFQDGPDLLLDVNCSYSAAGWSVTIRLTPEEIAEYRSAGRSAISRLAARVQDSGPRGEYQERHEPSRNGDTMREAVRAWRASMPRTAWLSGTRWYVPPENLLAFVTDPALRVRTPVADQTLWNITSANDGRFHGTARTELWVRAPEGGFTAMGSSSTTLDGTLSGEGEITIVFTPHQPDQPQTVGYGHLRRVDGEWRMEMQMATGTSSIAMHWAYMTQAKDATPSAGPPDDGALDGELRSDQWRWLHGSTWSATDEELFPDGATFDIDGYRNGYWWGEGTAASGSALRVAASVTPEGTLYLLFSVDDAPALARRGTLEGTGDAALMTWSRPPGGSTVGGARQTQASGSVQA